MRIATFVYGGELTARLHLSDEEKAVLRANRTLRYKVVFDRTPKEYLYFDRTWVTTVDDCLGVDLVIWFLNFSQAKRAEEEMQKRITQLTKEIAGYIPEPQPEPEPEPTTPHISERDIFYHMLLIAQTRWGKTNAISWRLAQVFPMVERGEATVILMEPKGVLIDHLLHLAPLYAMRERVIIIDPEDTPVAVNIFDKGDSSPAALNDGLGRILSVLATITTDLVLDTRLVRHRGRCSAR